MLSIGFLLIIVEQLCTSQPNKIIHGTLINSIRSYGFLSQTNNVKSSVCVIGPGDVRPDQLFSGDDPPDQYSLPLHTLQIAYAMRLASCLCSSIEALRPVCGPHGPRIPIGRIPPVPPSSVVSLFSPLRSAATKRDVALDWPLALARHADLRATN